MIVDSDVIIWGLRGNSNAQEILQREFPFKISAITFMEIVQGMKNRYELNIFLGQLKAWSTTVLQINQPISERAMWYVEEHFLSHALQIPDALIAATAVESGEALLTANDKHYKQIKNLKIQKFRP